MRIIFLSQLLPLPLDAGPKIRAFYVLRHLAEAGHEVTLVTFLRPGDRDADVRDVARFCRSVETVPLVRSRARDVRDLVASVGSSTPFLIRRDRSAAMTERLGSLARCRTFDALHADQLWMAPYAARLQVGLRVLDQHNAVFRVPERLARNQSNGLLRYALRREAAKLETFERAMCASFDRVVWVSEDDRAAFRGLPSGTGERVIPIAVDPTAREPLQRSRPHRVTFLGGLHWPPNAEGVRWFMRRVWPTVAARVPSAVLTVIGKGSARAFGRMPPGPAVEVTDYVRDLTRYLSETAAFVVPLRTGAGMRVKILDAWTWALPVVSTTIGAEGIVTSPGENLIVADEHEVFADSLTRVLKDRALAARLGANGRATVEALYDWRKVYPAWDQVYH